MGFRFVSVKSLVDRGEAEIKTGPFGTQLKASYYQEEGVPVINVRNIGFGSLKPEKLEFLGEEVVNRLSSHLLRERDIVFGRKGAVERHVYVRPEQNGWFQGSDCLRLRFASQRIDPLFISYFLLTEDHKAWMINQCSHGATMSSLNQGIIERLEIPVPDLPTQRRIAGILSAYDELIANNQRRIAILEEMARALYREWFVHYRAPGVVMGEDGVPEGWEVKTLQEVCELITDGAHYSPASVEGGYPIASVKDMTDWGFDLSSCRRIGKEDYENLVRNKCQPRIGDVLIAKDGSYLKHSFVIDRHEELVILSSVAILRPNGLIRPNYLNFILKDPSNLARMKGYVSGVALPRIILKEFKGFEIIVAPTKLQAQWDSIVAPMINLCQSLIRQSANLRRTRDLLLPRLMSGRVEVEVKT